ncbi:MAG: cupin [Lentisphaerae bacterium RIFOXYA12_FULL_48_11]|nr:MAG: cupin [Lentisphaerae bacterium RIFOXYA12_FULL_48_11]
MSDENDIRGKPINLDHGIDYATGSVVSKTIMDKKSGTLTLFSFDAGQGLSEHTSPYDATVQIIEGKAVLTIGGKKVIANAGELVIMPANIPHSVRAEERFKMMLIMIR